MQNTCKSIELFPMDYEEFRWAMNDTATIFAYMQK